MSSATNIVLYEPQCTGHEHVPFNAAFLQSVRAAWPDAQVTFFCANDHAENIRAYIRNFGGDLAGVVFKPFKPTRQYDVTHGWSVRRALMLPWSTLMMLWQTSRVLRYAKDRGAQHVMATSISRRSLFALQLLLRWKRSQRPVSVVVHTILNTLERSPRSILKRIVHFGRLIRKRQPYNLSYIVMAEPFRDLLQRAAQPHAIDVNVVDHPYLFNRTMSHRNILRGDRPVSLGFLGIGSRAKGMTTFVRLATALNPNREHSGPQFHHVGAVPDASLRSELKRLGWVSSTTAGMLNNQEYERRLSEIDYAMFPYNPDEYKYISSGAIFDALSRGVPVVALKNTYFSYCFEKFGPIGYLCDSLEEFEAVGISIAEGRRVSEYAALCDEVARAREKFSPEAVGRQLREVAR